MEGKYIDEELTYELIGAGYTVYNRLKYGYQEKYYQRGYEQELITQKKKFKKECKVVIYYNGKKIGRYFIDFLVEDKIVVELKVANDFHPKHISQVLAYLKAKNLKIGLILLFTKNNLRIKRIIN